MELKLLSEVLKLFDAPEFILLLSIFILWSQKKIIETFHSRRIRHTDSLSKLTDYITDHGDRNYFLIEQLVMDYLRMQIPYKGIILFFESVTPTENILDYRSGRKYVEFSKDFNHIYFVKNKSTLTREKIIAWFQYVFFGGISVIMLISSHKLIENEMRQYVAWFVASFYFFLIGLVGLINTFRIPSAEKLVSRFGLISITSDCDVNPPKN